MNFKEPNSKLVRWKLQLNEYDYEVEYKKESQNLVADALSRVNSEANTHSVDVGKYEIKNSETPLNEFNIQIVILMNLNSTTKDETLFKKTKHENPMQNQILPPKSYQKCSTIR